MAAMMIAAQAGRTAAPSAQDGPKLTSNQRNMLTSFRGASGGSRNSKTAARRKARNHVRVRAMRRRKAGRA
jgi:hypothetical protein